MVSSPTSYHMVPPKEDEDQALHPKFPHVIMRNPQDIKYIIKSLFS